MHEPLSLARFRELADAYGGVVARWPERHRDAAIAMASHPAARDILDRASGLDATLDTWRVAPPAASLRDRVIAGMPVPPARIAARIRLWWSGIGIAAALAGASAGVAAVAIDTSVDTASDGGTSFGEVAGSET